MDKELRKIVELNILPLTEVKRGRLNTLYSIWQSACSTLFDAIEDWDGFTELPLTSTNLHHLTYHGMRKDTKLPSQILECARREVFSRRKQNRTRNIPIRYDNRTMRFGSTDKGNPIIDVVSMESVERGKRIAIPIQQDGSYKRFLRFKNDGWVFNSFLLVRKDKSWTVQVIFTKTFDVKKPTEFRNIVGVDNGSTNLATVVVYNPMQKKVIRSFYLGRDVAPRQRQFEIRRAKLQSKGRIKDLTNDQSNFTKTRVYQIAHQIVDIAKEYDAYIAVEDLNGFTDIHYTVKANRKIHRIPTRLGEVIGRIAIENGVPMVVENPAYTSQDCNKCGERHKISRREFYCPGHGGYRVNRDLNASINIAQRAINHISNQTVFGQKPLGRMPVTASVCSDEGISSQHIHTSGMSLNPLRD